MLHNLFRNYLRWTRKEYLIPFLDGLVNLGRPSSVFFPYELIEQGLAIILSGLNNTMAIQSNLGWVWPYWVERQMDADAPEFIPTAINLIKTNLTRRNWTSFGLEDSARESMIDPVGMLTLNPYGWSVFPYLRAGGQNHFPPRMHGKVSQSLRGGHLPCIRTVYHALSDLEWSSEAMALRVQGEELAAFTHRLKNISSRRMQFTFGLALRPYNPLMIGHINKIRFKNRLWRVNDQPGLLLLDEPDRVSLSDRHQGDPLQQEIPKVSQDHLKSKSGIACGLAEFEIDLEAGETRELETLGTIAKLPAFPNLKFRHITRTTVESGRESRLAALERESGKGLSVRLPDPGLEIAFRAVKDHIHVFDDGDHFSPGTFLYHSHWFRDSAYLAMAFENMGRGDRVKPKIQPYLALQTSEGFFRSQRGEWDSNGQAMTTLVNHVRMGGDPGILNSVYPSLVKGARWINAMREKNRKIPCPHFGIMPAGFSAEHFGPNDHYYWDNFWSLSGLRAAAWAAGRLGKVRDAAWIQDSYLELRNDLLASMNWAMERIRPSSLCLPCSPYRWMDSAAIGNLVGISPLDVIVPTDPWVKETVEFLMANNLRDGLFFQKIIHTGLNPYLSAQLARALMSLGDERWFAILESLVAHATPTFTWPEAIHPRIFGGCMGDGDHGWSAAEFLNLMRDMLIREEGGRLLLGDGIPAKWYKAGMHLEVNGAPTFFGTVDYSLKWINSGLKLTWSIRSHSHQDRAEAYFLMPVSSGLEPGSLAVRSGGKVRIPLKETSGSMAFFAYCREDTNPVPIMSASAKDYVNKTIKDTL